VGHRHHGGVAGVWRHDRPGRVGEPGCLIWQPRRAGAAIRISAAANIGFAAILGLQLAPRLFASDKKLRNKALPLVLALLMLFMGGRILALAVAGPS
jgi:hypothetical protein